MPTNPTDAPVPQSANAYTGRIVALVTLLLGFIGAAAPVVGDLDLTSTAGIVAGIGALTAIAVKYLEGWQRYEGRVDALQVAALTSAATPAPTSAPDATSDRAVAAATPDPIPVVAAAPPPTPEKAANGTPPVAPSLP